MTAPLHVVTGAFGYSGQYIAQRLLDRGVRVATLTNSPQRPHRLTQPIPSFPLRFDDPDALARSLKGASVLYNTYWVRFDHGSFSHALAVDNTLALFRAARRAGVQRIVHVSITNPSADSPLPYFAGKAKLEQALGDSGIPHSILRPAVLFGPEDILVNNIAWALRKFPVFGVFGAGDYRLRPIHVDDLAALAVAHGTRVDRVTVDAVGPDSLSYRELVQAVGEAIGVRRLVLSIRPSLGRFVGRLIGAWERDVFLTKEEIEGLMLGLLDTNGPATGPTSLREWLANNGAHLGRRYASELRRRQRRDQAYLEPAPAELKPASPSAPLSGRRFTARVRR